MADITTLQHVVYYLKCIVGAERLADLSPLASIKEVFLRLGQGLREPLSTRILAFLTVYTLIIQHLDCIIKFKFSDPKSLPPHGLLSLFKY